MPTWLCRKWESYLRETFEETLQGGRGGLAEKAGGDPAPRYERASYLEDRWQRLRGRGIAAIRAEQREDASLLSALKRRMTADIQRRPTAES